MHPDPALIATITPSGNTVVERTTQAMLRPMPKVAALFTRIAVHGTADPFPDGYDLDGMRRAASLLAHARPGVILWNGSKGGAIGLAQDEALAAMIEAETGLRADTSGLALLRRMQATGIRRFGLITPYADAYQARLVAQFGRDGVEVVAESHLGMTDNLSYAGVPAATILRQAREVAAARPQAILAWCTNYPAAPLAAAIEAETGLPLWDATALGVVAALAAVGAPNPAGWGVDPRLHPLAPALAPAAAALLADYAGFTAAQAGPGFRQPRLEAEIADPLAAFGTPGSLLLVAEAGGRPAGCVALRPLEGDRCEVKRLWVATPFRGGGLGAQLVTRLLQEARGMGYATAYLDTEPATMGFAQRVYAALGFEPCGPFRDGQAGKGEGLVCMRRATA